MASVVSMPKVGMSVESCIITEWRKEPGDVIAVGDILFAYETDKSTMECESTEAGVLLEIFYQAFDEVPVLAPVCAVGQAGEDVSALRPKKEDDKTIGQPNVAQPQSPAQDSMRANPQAVSGGLQAAHDGEQKTSPRARRLAERKHVDLRWAEPSGPYGRIIERDVQKLIDSGTGLMTPAAATTGRALGMTGTNLGGRIGISDVGTDQPSTVETSDTAYQDIKMKGIRRAIAKNMEKSMFSIPQLTHHFSFDATALRNYRAALKAQPDAPKITLGDMVLFAAARVIKRHPEINAHLIDGDMLRCFEEVNLGFAVDTPQGLLVPVIKQAEQKTLAELAAETKRLAGLAKDGTLGPEDMSGGTFTVSNLGTFGVESFTPVINPPQVGILGICNIIDRVRANGDSIDIYPAMGISLTYDHRALDGAPASRFAGELCRALEDFPTLFENEEV